MNRNKKMKAVILAAGMGSRMSPLTDDCPKALLKVGERTILERMLSSLREVGIQDIMLVLGYMEGQIRSYVKENFSDLNICFTHNYSYGATNTAFSLLLAENFVGDSTFLKFDADVVFDKEILVKLIDCEYTNCLCIDRDIDLATEEIKVIVRDNNKVLRASKEVNPVDAAGESLGIEKISGETAPVLFAELREMMGEPRNYQQYYEAAYESLIRRKTDFHALDVTGLKWTELDTPEDLATAEKMFG